MAISEKLALILPLSAILCTVNLVTTQTTSMVDLATVPHIQLGVYLSRTNHYWAESPV